jgi:PAS domain S-box-containing protein
VLATLDGTVTYCNRAATELYGWPVRNLIGRNIFQVALADVAVDQSAAILERVCQGDGWWGETRAWRRDGSIFPSAVTIAPFTDEEGHVDGLIGVAIDLTSRRALEQQFRHAQKMEAVGLIVGGVAHDFNNLLTAMRGYSELALSALEADDPVREDVEQIAAAADRAAELTGQLLSFSRRNAPDPALLDLNDVVGDLHRLMERVIGEDVDLLVSRDPELWPVRADRGQIDQVLLNLVINGRDALPDGGQLTVETANEDVAERQESYGLAIEPGEYAVLRVSDAGIGIDAETRERLFEPFYTTKETGKGTGLGLATVYGIVRQAGGLIEVASEPGQGTTFSILFPHARDTRRRRTQPSGVASLRGGNETVLLVEDDDQVRPIAQRVLSRLGYQVLTARGADLAFRMAREHKGPIDLLLTDVVLPRESGVELSTRLASARPSMQILYMSGYADAAPARRQPLPRGARFLAKPFTPEMLARAVRDVLDAKDAADASFDAADEDEA